MASADIPLLAAAAAVFAAPVATGWAGRQGTRWSLGAIFSLFAVNLYLAWTSGTAPEEGTLEGQAAAFGILAATALFLVGLVSVTVSVLASKGCGGQTRTERVGE